MKQPAVGIVLPTDETFGVPELVRLGQAAEAAGLDAVVVGETRGPDAVTVLAALALSTSRVRLGACILPIASRPPALAAMTFAALTTLAPGRVFAGFGLSTPAIVDGWFGLSLQRPVSTMRDYVAIFREAIGGSRTDVDLAVLRSHGFRLTVPAAPPPVYLGVMGRRMVELAGEIADGVILAQLPPEGVGERLRWLDLGIQRSHRERASVRTALTAFHVYLGRDPDAARARIGRRLGYYASMPTHNAAFQGGADAMVDALAVVGGPGDGSRLAQRIDACARAGIDEIFFRPWTDRAGSVDGYLETIAAAGRALPPGPS